GSRSAVVGPALTLQSWLDLSAGRLVPGSRIRLRIRLQPHLTDGPNPRAVHARIRSGGALGSLFRAVRCLLPRARSKRCSGTRASRYFALFLERSEWCARYHEACHHMNVAVGDWSTAPDGRLQRVVRRARFWRA